MTKQNKSNSKSKEIHKPDESSKLIKFPSSSLNKKEIFISNKFYELKIIIRFYAVGMKFIGKYRFNKKDQIKLEKEDNNPYDSNAIKIIAQNILDTWTHVAYVTRSDAIKLREIKNFENYKTIFVRRFPESAELALINE